MLIKNEGFNTVILEEYLSQLKLERNLSENTIFAYRADLSRFIRKCEDEGIADFNEISEQHIRGFIVLLKEIGLSQKSLARYHSSLKNFFGYLFLNEYIKQNPVDRVPSSAIPKKLPEVLSLEEIDTILLAIETDSPAGVRDRTIIEVLYACGIRVSELIGLKISSLHLDEEAIKVLGKGGKERFVPIGSSAIDWLKKYLYEARISLTKDKLSMNYVFLNLRGKKITRQAIWQIIRKYAEIANCEKRVYPHIFRHSFATHLVEGGANLRAVQEMLGHTDISVTQIYTNVDRTFVKEEHRMYHPRG